MIDLFLGFVIGPIMGKLSIPARIELTTRLMPKMVIIERLMKRFIFTAGLTGLMQVATLVIMTKLAAG